MIRPELVVLQEQEADYENVALLLVNPVETKVVKVAIFFCLCFRHSFMCLILL